MPGAYLDTRHRNPRESEKLLPLVKMARLNMNRTSRIAIYSRELIRIPALPLNHSIVTHDNGFVRVTHTFDGTLLSCRELIPFLGIALDWMTAGHLA